MVEISVNNLFPFIKQVILRRVICNTYTPAGIFAPNYIPLHIADIEEKGLKHLLVQSCSVKSALFGYKNIIFKGFLCGSSVYSVGIKALVKNKTLEHAFAVEQILSVLEFGTAKPEIRKHLVFTASYSGVVNAAFADLPEMYFG